MDIEELNTKLVSLMARIIGLDEKAFSIDDTLESLGGDSLDAIEFVMAIEDNFEIEIPDNDVNKIQTIRQMSEYLQKRLS